MRSIRNTRLTALCLVWAVLAPTALHAQSADILSSASSSSAQPFDEKAYVALAMKTMAMQGQASQDAGAFNTAVRAHDYAKACAQAKSMKADDLSFKDAVDRMLAMKSAAGQDTHSNEQSEDLVKRSLETDDLFIKNTCGRNG